MVKNIVMASYFIGTREMVQQMLICKIKDDRLWSTATLYRIWGHNNTKEPKRQMVGPKVFWDQKLLFSPSL